MAGTEFDFTAGRPIGVTRLDTAYCDLARDADGRVRVDLDHPDGAAGVTLWADDRFGYLMVYTGDTLEDAARRTALAVEPMTCPPDAFRTGTDVTVLAARRPVDGVLGDHPPLIALWRSLRSNVRPRCPVAWRPSVVDTRDPVRST